MSVRRLASAGILALVVVACGLVLASSAIAFEGYTVTARFGAEGSGDGQFKGPFGVAVNETTGDLYVTDSANNRVQVLSPTGAYITQFNGGPEHTLSDPTDIAIDNTTGPAKGDVYIADQGHGKIDVFNEQGTYLRQLPPELTGDIVLGIAVDTSGNVWVSITGRYFSGGSFSYVEGFNDAGSFITKFTPKTGLVPGLAVDSLGDFYIADVSNGVDKYGPAFEEISRFGVGNTEALATNPVTGNVFADFKSHTHESSKASKICECPPFAEPPSCEAEEFGEIEGLSESFGIAVTGGGTVFASEFGSGRIAVFRFVLLADVSTGAASAVERTTATVSGTVKRDGKPATYSVQYGEGASLGLSTPPVKIESESEEEVSVALTALNAATTYSYRFVTENENGTKYGEVKTVTTLPAVEGVSTGPAEGVTTTEARLTGALEPNGFDAHYYFQYGESTGYGQVSPAPPGVDAESVFGLVSAATGLTGLVPGTTYHYRIVGENKLGQTVGGDETFTTLSRKPLVGVSPASFVGPTSAVLNAVVNPEHSGDTHCYLVFGVSESYGTVVPAGEIDLGSGYGEDAVVKTVEGLQPGTTYHYAVVASNPEGEVQSADESFTTPAPTLPVVETGGVSEVAQSTARISGTVESRGVPTRYEFDLGTDTTYGSRVFGEAASAAGTETFTLRLQDLTAGTTYHYRIVATNVYGTSYGTDRTFTTPGFPTALLAAPATTLLVASPVFAPFSTVAASSGEAPVKTKAKAKHKKKTKTGGRGRRATRPASGRHGGKGGQR